MKQILSLILILCAAYGANAKTINVVAGMSKPPYIYKLADGTPSGYEIELIEQLFARMGLKPVFHLIPYARSMRMLTEPNVDAVMTASPLVFKDKNILTKPYISYQNVVISLAKNELEITAIEQLAPHSIAAFQMASRVLGKPFAIASAKSPYYIELSKQSRQLEMLKQGKVKALVMDVNIFNHFKAKQFPDVSISTLFPTSLYGMALNEPELVRLFNRTWLTYRKSADYQQLKQKYRMQQRL